MPDQMSLQQTAPVAPVLPDAPDTETTDLSPHVAQQANNLKDQIKLMNVISRTADRYANSTMVPKDYQGRPDNCFVACELATRMNASPTFVMQNLYVVQGRPSWSGQACISIINGCGMFKGPVKFNWVGTKGADDWGCYCTAVNRFDGETLTGTLVDMKMVKGEGWNKNKWLTMPEQMFKYRAASFFARTYCPNALMGYSVEGEAEDIEQATPEKKVVKVE